MRKFYEAKTEGGGRQIDDSMEIDVLGERGRASKRSVFEGFGDGVIFSPILTAVHSTWRYIRCEKTNLHTEQFEHVLHSDIDSSIDIAKREI